MLIISFSAMVLITAYYSWTSRLNQFFFFGRTVSDGFTASSEARRITRRFVLLVWIGCAAAGLLMVVVWRGHLHAYFVWPLLIQLVVPSVAFAEAHGETGRVVGTAPARTVVEVPLTAAGEHVPSLGMLLTPIVMVGVVGLGALLAEARGATLASAPGRLGESLDAHGVATLFSFGLGMATAGLVLLLVRTRARVRTPLGGNVLQSLMVSSWAAVIAILTAVGMVMEGGHLSRTVTKVVMIVAVAAALGLNVFRMIKIRRFAPPAAELDADENWRWGLFYCNRNDPALFVQSRFGVGYTLNYGRATAWPLTIVFVAMFVGTAVITTHDMGGFRR